MGGILVTALMLSLVLSLPAFAEAQSYPQGMISYWKLDEPSGNSATDVVGGYHGVLHGGARVAGQVGGAVAFNGVDDYIEVGCGYPDMQALDVFSLEAWVTWIGAWWYRTIIGKPAGYSTGCMGFHHGWGMQVRDGHVWGWSNEDYYWPWARTVETIPTGEWTHVVVTSRYLAYAQREFHIYINGVEATLEHGLGGTILPSPLIYIGALPAWGSYYEGKIDEVAVYGRELLPEEILQHYQNGLSGRGYELDSDGDGILDDIDQCPSSDLTPVVVIDGCDTGVTTVVLPDGCTIADEISTCATSAGNHGDFVSCVTQGMTDLMHQGIISGREKGAITSCAARANIP